MTLTLPIPDKRLSPNHTVATIGARMAKSSATKKARQRAKLLTLSAARIPCPDFTGYSLAFFWPDARRRDDDNAIGSIKAYKDGIADALGVDDWNLRMKEVPTFQIDRSNPRVEITLT